MKTTQKVIHLSLLLTGVVFLVENLLVALIVVRRLEHRRPFRLLRPRLRLLQIVQNLRQSGDRVVDILRAERRRQMIRLLQLLEQNRQRRSVEVPQRNFYSLRRRRRDALDNRIVSDGRQRRDRGESVLEVLVLCDPRRMIFRPVVRVPHSRRLVLSGLREMLARVLRRDGDAVRPIGRRFESTDRAALVRRRAGREHLVDGGRRDFVVRLLVAEGDLAEVSIIRV